VAIDEERGCPMVDEMRLDEFLKDMGFAESTIQATVWLRKFHPERLRNWYKSHPNLEEAIDGYQKR
jgi:hypothetical protein